MEWLKAFSTDYANAVTSVAACGALLLATITLWYLKREYVSKYRPYVTPVIHVEPIPKTSSCVVSIIPSNIGEHPCKIKLTNIKLHVGDETFETPSTKEWIIIGSHGATFQMPAGHINDTGVTKIREGRYRQNRIELSFTLESISMENKYTESKLFSFEIDVLGEKPLALFRSEWCTDA